MENYTGSFENWWSAAELYCSEHPELDFWDFQVQEFASDIAWRMEGIPFSEQQMDRAFNDWTNGCSPYSKRSRDTATTPEEGYDRDGQWDRYKSTARVKTSQFALDNGVPIERLHEFLTFYWYGNDALFFDEQMTKNFLGDWEKQEKLNANNDER